MKMTASGNGCEEGCKIRSRGQKPRLYGYSWVQIPALPRLAGVPTVDFLNPFLSSSENWAQ